MHADIQGKKYGIVLLAHGSRDPETETEARKLGRQLAETRPLWEIASAYLNQEPSLSATLTLLCNLGCRRIEIFPLLVFPGKHIREDIPRLVAEEKTKRPELRIGLHPHLTQLPGFSSLLGQAVDAISLGKEI